MPTINPTSVFGMTSNPFQRCSISLPVACRPESSAQPAKKPFSPNSICSKHEDNNLLLPPNGAGRANVRHGACRAAILPEILPDSLRAQRLFVNWWPRLGNERHHEHCRLQFQPNAVVSTLLRKADAPPGGLLLRCPDGRERAARGRFQ